MKFEELINALSFERYEALKRAVELGKWPDGRVLGQEELQTSLQVLIAYDQKYKSEFERIGFVPRERISSCDHEKQSQDHAEPVTVIAKG